MIKYLCSNRNMVAPNAFAYSVQVPATIQTGFSGPSPPIMRKAGPPGRLNSSLTQYLSRG